MVNPSFVPGKRSTLVCTPGRGVGTKCPLSGKLVSQDQSSLDGQKGYSPSGQGTNRSRDCGGALGSHIVGLCKKQWRATHRGRPYAGDSCIAGLSRVIPFPEVAAFQRHPHPLPATCQLLPPPDSPLLTRRCP